MSDRATCPTAGTTTTAPGWACCAATTRTARCAGSRSTRATCSTSPTPTIDGDTLVLQAVRYPELWRDNGGFDADGVHVEWTLDLRTGTVSERPLDDRVGRVPPHRRPAGRPARPVRGVRRRRQPGPPRPDHRRGRRAPVRHAGHARGSRRGGVRAVDLRAGRREQRLLPGLRLRPGTQRQRPGDPGRRRLRRPPVARSSCRNVFRTASTGTGSPASRQRGARGGSDHRFA